VTAGPATGGPAALARARLIRQLQLAHAGEIAAAHAYRGHWRATADREERERIRAIEEEEWHHRAAVGEMLRGLGSGPRPAREAFFHAFGRVLGALCHLSGWLLPMYGAGWLEKRNVREYEDAAVYARDAGEPALVEPLLAMAETEWEHERYFRAKVLAHRWRRFLPVWAPPPPKESIRAPFEKPAA
jgi:demethoxyubiquinone hydroxylase (CLK1/Coq7/Cat5 family)